MRARMVKPGFFTSASLARCDLGARLLFVGLWCLADREGLLLDLPKAIAAQVFPRDALGAPEVDLWLAQLESEGLIARYVTLGKECIEVCNFKEHQKIHDREAKSELPRRAQGSPKVDLRCALGSPIPPEVNRSEVNRSEGARAIGSAENTAESWAEDDYGDIFERLLKAHPKQSAPDRARVAWQHVIASNPPEITREIEARHARWCKCSKWREHDGQFVPKLANWLTDGDWRNEPPKSGDGFREIR